jgi:hypothetical protein
LREEADSKRFIFIPSGALHRLIAKASAKASAKARAQKPGAQKPGTARVFPDYLRHFCLVGHSLFACHEWLVQWCPALRTISHSAALTAETCSPATNSARCIFGWLL